MQVNTCLNEQRNTPLWKLEKKGRFTVKPFCNFLVNRNGSGENDFPAKQIWKVKAPPCVAFFAWDAGRESILTIDKLKRRGNTFMSGCFLCKRAEENSNHILLWCLVAYSLWTMVYGILGINWVIAGNVKNELWAWEGLSRGRKIVKLISQTIF